MASFYLPANYRSRAAVRYFDDIAQAADQPLYQPEVYEVAEYFLRKTGRSTVIDFGCGFAGKLMSLKATRRVGIDFGPNIDYCRSHYGDAGEWITADFEQPDSIEVVSAVGEDCVVVCADVVEHLLNPTPLLKTLADWYVRGAVIITSTPDRVRAWGCDHFGPPPNPTHVREWALEEYRSLLDSAGLFCSFAGYTLNNDIDLKLETIITIHDKSIFPPPKAVHGERQRPLALLAVYNEADCIECVVLDWLMQGCDLHIIDNWSSDASWDILNRLAAKSPERITLERYPSRPSRQFEWRDILRRKEAIAVQHPSRWIIHTDADELRRSPFSGMTMKDALFLAQDAGATRVNFTLINFRPTLDEQDISLNMGNTGSAFEFASKPDEFDQAKAWLQPQQQIDLVTSGGHVAKFDGAAELPYRFLLMHYPVRSPDHGRRKILTERAERWSPEERAMGWHVQYDGYHANSRFLWNSSDLILFTETFWADHGLAIITDIAQSGLRKSTFMNPTTSIDAHPMAHSNNLSERLAILEAAYHNLVSEFTKDGFDIPGLVHNLDLKYALEVEHLKQLINSLAHCCSKIEAELDFLRKGLEASDRSLSRQYRAAIQRLQS